MSGYFNKRTQNAYDFNVLFDTPIFFPVAWDHSDINGVTGKLNLVEHHGLSAFVVMAHTNAIYFPPGVGGVLLEPRATTPGCSFRIDHDQKFNATTNLQYAFNKPRGRMGGAELAVRFGPGRQCDRRRHDLLTLTPAQQAAAGVSCGGVPATPSSGFTSCAPDSIAASRLVVPAAGTGDPLNNPIARRAASSVRSRRWSGQSAADERQKLRVRFSVINLTNQEALYNFLSTFSGTHFVEPRTYQVQLGWTF